VGPWFNLPASAWPPCSSSPGRMRIRRCSGAQPAAPEILGRFAAEAGQPVAEATQSPDEGPMQRWPLGRHRSGSPAVRDRLAQSLPS